MSAHFVRGGPKTLPVYAGEDVADEMRVEC